MRARALLSFTFATTFLTFSVISAPLSATPTTPGVAKGKFIRAIRIKVRDIFDQPDESFPYTLANSVKINTRESVVRRELLFKEGDPYNPFAIEETARNLRLLRYLRDIRVKPTFDGDAVDVEVEAQDTWTLIPGVTYSAGTGRRNRGVALSDSNFLGTAARLEGRVQQEQQRETYGLVYSDPQFMGTRRNFEMAAFDRSDGSIYSALYRSPFRSLRQQESWSFSTQVGDTVGRLFKNGEENYIYRQNNDSFTAVYTFAGPGQKSGSDTDELTGIYSGQKILSRRYSVGYSYVSDAFYRADRDDFENLDLDPSRVSNDPALLPKSRRFSGPLLRYQNIEPNFLPMNYIDRFDRVEDYNLGDESSTTVQFAPTTFGSMKNSFILTSNRSRGWKFSDTSFLRGEIGGSTRYEDETLNNSLLRTELKYYNVVGDWFVGDTFLGRHTLVGNFYVDFGEKLDRDRQLLLGADNALRGYDENTFEGDKRLVLNLEERSHLVDDVLQVVSIGTAVFLDVGGATRGAISTIVSEDLYADAGVGLRIGFPRASGSGIVRIDLAVPLRDGLDGSRAYEPRIIASAGQLFSGRLRSEQVGAENASVGIGFDR